MLIFGRFATFYNLRRSLSVFPNFFSFFKLDCRNMGTYRFKTYIFLGVMTTSPSED